MDTFGSESVAADLLALIRCRSDWMIRNESFSDLCRKSPRDALVRSIKQCSEINKELRKIRLFTHRSKTAT